MVLLHGRVGHIVVVPLIVQIYTRCVSSIRTTIKQNDVEWMGRFMRGTKVHDRETDFRAHMRTPKLDLDISVEAKAK